MSRRPGILSTLLPAAAVLLAGCPGTGNAPPPRNAEPCSEYLPLAWEGETLSLEGSHPDLTYVNLDLAYRGLFSASEPHDIYSFNEFGTPQVGDEWTATRTFTCHDGRTDGLSLLDDCTFAEAQPLAWDDMAVGFEQEIDTSCEEFGWTVTGTASVPDCSTKTTPLGSFETCSMRWELSVDFDPADPDNQPVDELIQIAFSKQVGPIHWNSLVLVGSSLVGE